MRARTLSSILFLILIVATYEFMVTTSSPRGRGGIFALPSADSVNPYNLPKSLAKLTNELRSIQTHKEKHEHLLYLASESKPLHPRYMIPANKVPGCQSNVYITATLRSGKVYFKADSDSLITKGLSIFLAKGLSGSTPKEISQINPMFIQHAGITASLTPGRNNGFLNMFKVMVIKAQELDSPS